MKKVHVHWTFPENVIQELSSLVDEGNRSHFVAEATQEALRRLKLLKGIERAAGAWKSNAHPELKTSKDIERHVRKLRQSWNTRTKGSPSGQNSA